MTTDKHPVLGGRLSDDQVAALLALDIPARLATIDQDGFPWITPIWFLWEDGAFYMTSIEGRPHLRNLARDPHAAICIDTEDRITIAGVRPNRQVKARGLAELSRDEAGYWTERITKKYVPGAEGEMLAAKRAAMPRILITLRPDRLVRIGTPV